MKKRYLFLIIIAALILIPLVVAGVRYFVPVPAGVSYESEEYQTDDAEFLYDLTYTDNNEEINEEQEIFEEIYTMIDEAEEFLVIDMFLFNDDYNHDTLEFPPLSQNLTDKLTAKKTENPDIDIIFITDGINTFYDTYTPAHINELKEAGIEVIFTDLSKLRDSNPLYSGFYRTYFQWLGTSENQWLVNALRPQGPQVNIRSYLTMLNFKANHRKIIINEKNGLITSANPHDASVHHSNIAVKLSGDILYDMLESERSVVNFGGGNTRVFSDFADKLPEKAEESEGQYTVKLITENKIKDNIIEMVNNSKEGDTLSVGLFYLSDRDVVGAFKAALERGAELNIILDINQDAFGNEKNGVPNRPVADELMSHEKPANIRWYKSSGEQYHAKFIMLETGDEVIFNGGSANFTRRNLDNYNLETNVLITAPANSEFAGEVTGYYDRLWTNESAEYTLDYEEEAEESLLKTILYRVQEATGLSTF
ncbi:MAG: phospholipase D family protein [Jeotgalicoccus sp.]